MKKLLVALSCVLVAGTVAAQGFPNKTIRLVSGVSPGSASDAMAPPDVRARVRALGVEPFNLLLEAFEALIRREPADDAQLIKTAGVRPT